MNPTTLPHLSIQVPGAVINPAPRSTVSRKAVPTRKPVGEPSMSTTKSKIDVPSTQALKSTSAIHEVSQKPNLQGTGVPFPDGSSISSFATYSVAQPTKAVVGELPEGWSSAIDPDGRTYYMNHLTKATTWNKPEFVPSHLMPGWEERMTPDGRVFYCNTQTQVTTWERPSMVSAVPAVASPSPFEGAQSPHSERKLVPLPLWWEARTTKDGRVYYCNTQTQVTAWESPLESNAHNQAMNQLGMDDGQSIPLPSLPAGWEERSASDGRVYFCNLDTQVTTWERPHLPVASSAVNQPTRMESPLSPLSSNWVQRRTSTGQAVYFNTLTNEQTHMPPTPPTDFPFTKTGAMVHSQSDLPPTPISPSIDWESPQYQSKSARRRSHFSLGSISSASTIANRMSKMRIPSGPSSAAVVNGTKNAAEMSMKGMKTAGKVLKNNKGVIIVSMKVAHTILKSTTGVDLGGIEDLFGGDVEVDVGDDAGGDCSGDDVEVDAEAADEVVLEPYGVDGILAEQQDTTFVQDIEPPPDECAIQDQQVDSYVQDVYITDQFVVATDTGAVVVTDPVFYDQDTAVVVEEQIVVVDEEQTITSTTTVQELTFEQEAAGGAFSGDSVWVQDAVLIEDPVIPGEEGPVLTEYCIQETVFTSPEVEDGVSNEICTQSLVVEESATVEECFVLEITSQQATTQEIIVEATVCEETSIQVPIIEDTGVQEMNVQATTETEVDKAIVIRKKMPIVDTAMSEVKSYRDGPHLVSISPKSK